jgi:hypothetical protein
MTRDDDDERCKDQTVGDIRYHTSDDQVCRDQNGQGAKTRPESSRINEYICRWYLDPTEESRGNKWDTTHKNTGNANLQKQQEVARDLLRTVKRYLLP